MRIAIIVLHQQIACSNSIKQILHIKENIMSEEFNLLDNKNISLDNLVNNFCDLVKQSQEKDYIGHHINLKRYKDWENKFKLLKGEDEKQKLKAVLSIWSSDFIDGYNPLHIKGFDLLALLYIDKEEYNVNKIKEDIDQDILDPYIANKLTAFASFLCEVITNKDQLYYKDHTLQEDNFKKAWENKFSNYNQEDIKSWKKNGFPKSAINTFLFYENEEIFLTNGCMRKATDYIIEIEKDVYSKKTDWPKLKDDQRLYVAEQIKEEITQSSVTVKANILVDQFFNVLDKYQGNGNIGTNNGDVVAFYDAAYKYVNQSEKKKKNAAADNANKFLDVLKDGNSKNIILYGAPGTGKTYNAKRIIEEYDKNKNENLKDRIEIVQFHSSFSYEDFIEGIRPIKIDTTSGLQFELKDGVFRNFCKKAKGKEENYYFIIDEINRAELSRVFGELLYCLEYRGEEGKIKTQYSTLRKEEDKEFFIPENVIVIGTMNTTDKSIDSFDLALRRRFIWLEFIFNPQAIYEELSEYIDTESLTEFIAYAEKVNEKITDLGLSKDYQIGHSYFMKINSSKGRINKNNILFLKNNFLKPLLKEYLRPFFSENEIEDKVKSVFEEAIRSFGPKNNNEEKATNGEN